jgi:antitoxin PrlF
MSKAAKKDACCTDPQDLKVEAIVSIDERGQMVLPKDIREKLSLGAGSKLALVTKERDGAICCIYMFKAEELMAGVRERLGPLLDNRSSG